MTEAKPYFVTVSGEAWTPKVGPAPFKPTKQPESRHDGWRVVGHPPGAMESAKEAADKECAGWASLSKQERAEKLRSRMREPKPWDEAAWRKDTKPKPVRSKPYTIPAAADQCADLARKAGWLDVRIIELKKVTA